jgi:hypothetical protein
METSNWDAIESRAGIHPIIHLESPEKTSHQSLAPVVIDVFAQSR